MTEQERLAKNASIKKAMEATHEKRKSQLCRIFTVKIDESKLSREQKEELKMIFIEAKWLWNDILRWSDEKEENKPWNYNIGKTIQAMNKEGILETKELKYIHSQMKQEVQKQLCSNIKTLHTLKEKGLQNPGKINYKSRMAQVHIKQIRPNWVRGNGYVKIPNVHGYVKIEGLEQFINIPNIEYACADLLNTPRGYYLAVCTYTNKNDIKEKDKIEKTIGIDFGCSTSFTTSEGEKISCSVTEPDRLKRLQRKLDRQIYQKDGHNRFIMKDKLCKDGKVRKCKVLLEHRSNNAKKTQLLINKEYQKMSNRKNDLANKIVAKFKQYETVVIQDELLTKWKEEGHGKVVQHSVLGRVKEKLMKLPNVAIISKSMPTTKLCTKCGEWHDEITLSNRVFQCSCGVNMDRDIHAARNMIWFYENNVGVGRTEFKRGETESMVKAVFNTVPHYQPTSHEAHSL